MWFSNTPRNLANELNYWLDRLLAQQQPDTSRAHLQRQPQRLGSLEHLQRDWSELQRIRQHLNSCHLRPAPLPNMPPRNSA